MNFFLIHQTGEWTYKLDFTMKQFLFPKIIFQASLFFYCYCGHAQISFNLPSNPALVNIIRVEYFFDIDPGFGNGSGIPLSAGTNITINNFAVNITGLANGFHRFYVRCEEAGGQWSFVNWQNLYIISTINFPSNPIPVNITAAEYFFDSDPGPGVATAIPVTAPGTTTTISNYAINITSLSNGMHRLYVRTKDLNGRWSFSNWQNLYIIGPINFPSNPSLANITAAEYFFDTDPGFGLATPIPVAVPGTITTINNYAINITSLSTGIHRLYVRTKDAGGHWSFSNENNLAILVSSLNIPSNPVLQNITLFEYFFDTDPGFGKGTIVAVTGTTNLVNYMFTADISGLSDNMMHTLYIRALDAWSLTNVSTFGIGTPLPVTLISFTASVQPDNTVLLNWSTSQEVNNKYFYIERAEKGTDFTQIGEVDGKGTTSDIQSYSFTDLNPIQGLNFYRLKQVDIDGHFTFTPVVSVMIQNKSYFNIFPNPVHDMLTISIGDVVSEKGEFRVIDLNGKICISANAVESNIQQVNISTLAAGTYTLQYITEKNVRSVKFIKY
jgi:hypothetical protein